jgi:hypothetical protein
VLDVIHQRVRQLTLLVRFADTVRDPVLREALRTAMLALVDDVTADVQRAMWDYDAR